MDDSAALSVFFWPRFTERGALRSICGGLITAVGLIIFSPVISGASSSLISDRHVNFAFFPLNNPGIVAFFLGWLGQVRPHASAGTDRGWRGKKWPCLKIRRCVALTPGRAADA